MSRFLSIAALLGAIFVSGGCKGGASDRCDAIYSKIEQMPEFKEGGLAKYGNELRAAFGERCSKLPEEELKCLESKSTAREIGEHCKAGAGAMDDAIKKVSEWK
jgi:hypothetical protein